jgi:hypothetical protein
MNNERNRLQQLALTTSIVLSGIVGSGSVVPANALTFNFTSDNTLSSDVVGGFTQAGDRWSAVFNDPVTVNIKIDFKNLGTNSVGAGILGVADSSRFVTEYTNVYNALNSDAKSADDSTAVASLRSSPGFDLLINQTKNNPTTPPNSATPYLDKYFGTAPNIQNDFNNTYINLSTANAKALNIFNPALNLIPTDLVSDGFISFSNTYIWDFNPNDGIDTNAFDFVGVAAHEIGHILGFTSGVDVLDFNKTAFNDYEYLNVNTLDLFRYSAQSKQDNAIDWTADARDKYFSIDGGNTPLALLSTGLELGDRKQASHWKDGLGLGIMGPTFSEGDLRQITALDLQAFDVIGWDRGATVTTTAVPEPENYVGTLICALVGFGALAKRRKKSIELARKSIAKV